MRKLDMQKTERISQTLESSAVVLQGGALKQNGEKRGRLCCFYILLMFEKLQIAAFCPFLYSLRVMSPDDLQLEHPICHYLRWN